MGPDAEGFSVEADSEAAPEVIRVFLDWAEVEQDIRVLFTPDTLMAIDNPHRQGFLYDEVYFVSLWARCRRTVGTS
jgi:hypothetical protein